ncbi:putative Mn2+ efflux pump MntP [Nakamurella sp. UYEF19]|uniref:manganese efflux pump MntP n=1 Tax=Nakamurella sp. UYEF19 TaxID=1756392 RepID=UPI0033969A99
MSFWTLTLIAFGVSADAFAVALGKGLRMPRLDRARVLIIAATFGAFQALMPLVGWLLGISFAGYITGFDHWVAFGLLGLLGGKMLWEAGSSREGTARDEDTLEINELLVLALATSIDALAVGISFSFLDVHIGWAVVLIGVVALIVTAAGVVLGHRVGSRLGKPAEVAGGVILILIGVRVLLDHLGIW